MNKLDLPVNDIVNLYEAGMTLTALADKYDVCYETIRRRLDEEDVDRRSRGTPNGLLKDYDLDDDGYVYVLECIREEDGEKFYYVGETQKPVIRITRHEADNGDFIAPDSDGVRSSDVDFDIVSIERLIPVNGGDVKNDLMRIEQETVCKVAIEYETTNVIGS